MAIDTSIIARGMHRVEMESPANALAKILQVQDAQQNQQMNALKMDEYRSGLQEKNALADLYKGAYGADGKLDRAAILRGAADRGLGAKIPTLQKGFADEDKTAADTQKAQIEAHLKKFEVAGQIVAGVRDQATWELARQKTAQVFGAEAAAQMPAQYDPVLIEQKRLQAMSVKEQLAAKHQELTLAETGRHNRTTEGLTAQGHAVTKRGQDLKFQTDSGANAVAGQAIVGKKIQDVELKLQDDYRQESKGFSETSTAMKKVFGAIETADKNPGSALAAGTAFMKVLDPNSVVRETELGMALNASGWFDRATNIANTLKNGRVMTAEQKKNLRAAAEDLFEEAKAAQREIDVAYRKRATDYGASPERVIVDRGQNTTRAKAAQSNIRSEADKILGIK